MKEANNRISFTKTSIDALPFEPKGKQKIYYDSNPTDLSLIVSQHTKTFYLQARVKNGKKTKVSLGKYGAITLNQAKEEVVKVRAKLNAGIHPNLERKKLTNQAEIDRIELEKQQENDRKVAEFQIQKNIESLDWLLNEYRDEHIIKHKGGSESSINDINDSKFYFKNHTFTFLKMREKTKTRDKGFDWDFDRNEELPNWLDRPYREITQREVLARFKLLSVALPKNNAGVLKPMTRSYQKAFKNLGAAYSWILNKTQAFTDEKTSDEMIDSFMDNPVEIITRLKLWTASKPRENFIDFFSYDSYLWWKAADEYRYEGMLARDYIFVSLLQGGRSIEVAPLSWDDINLDSKTIKYDKTKNKQTYEVPMTKLVFEILERRFKEKKPEDKYVFAFSGSKYGYIVKSARWYFEEIAKISGVKISHHDFRRTITNIALQDGMGIEKITIDHILKHKLQGTDINYFVKNKRIILNALQKIEDTILNQVEHYKVNGNKK
ncbi:integrase family protein [Methylovorus glucosotrophus]|uniref:Integrase family protein n=1 Tax=Methylovorus glucosotrophus (strain SIP3-4) TaxID=582744 RepID=C6X804_METGS|nr:integrase family protein [Methylovorus glucosotrophus]ACT51331.1 integrase family protein [Methylovorus glucosotrophus SIP3-4]